MFMLLMWPKRSAKNFKVGSNSWFNQIIDPNTDKRHRSVGAANVSPSQMTIFYCGKVNVYDGVPVDKARAIMHIAASPFPLSQDDTSSGSASLRPIPCQLHSASPKSGSLSPYATISLSAQGDKMAEYSHQYREEGNVAQETDIEGQTSRQLSLQRYREKRKDRGRFKSRKKIGFCSTPNEVYLNQQVRAEAPNGQSSRSSTGSPTQPAPPHALCGSSENQAKNASLLVDLNDKGVQEW